MRVPEYYEAAADPRTREVVADWVTGVLEQLKPQAVAICGISGALVGHVVSWRTGIPLVIVRKAGESSGQSGMSAVVTGHYGVGFTRWVFLDDLVAEGTTYRRVRDAGRAVGVLTGDAVAAVLYNQRADNPRIQRRWSSLRPVVSVSRLGDHGPEQLATVLEEHPL